MHAARSEKNVGDEPNWLRKLLYRVHRPLMLRRPRSLRGHLRTAELETSPSNLGLVLLFFWQCPMLLVVSAPALRLIVWGQDFYPGCVITLDNFHCIIDHQMHHVIPIARPFPPNPFKGQDTERPWFYGQCDWPYHKLSWKWRNKSQIDLRRKPPWYYPQATQILPTSSIQSWSRAAEQLRLGSQVWHPFFPVLTLRTKFPLMAQSFSMPPLSSKRI